MSIITVTMKSWEIGIWEGIKKGAKILGWLLLSSIVTTLMNFFASYSPSTAMGMAELAMWNIVLASIWKWIQVHQSVSGALTNMPNPTPATPPTPPVDNPPAVAPEVTPQN